MTPQFISAMPASTILMRITGAFASLGEWARRSWAVARAWARCTAARDAFVRAHRQCRQRRPRHHHHHHPASAVGVNLLPLLRLRRCLVHAGGEVTVDDKSFKVKGKFATASRGSISVIVQVRAPVHCPSPPCLCP